MVACALSPFSCVLLFVTLWTVAHQAPLFLGILQARILEWVAMPSSKGSSLPSTLNPYFLRVLYCSQIVLVLGGLHRVFVVACKIFNCGIWDLVPWPGIKPRPPALETWSLSRWITREVPPFRIPWAIQKFMQVLKTFLHPITLRIHVRLILLIVKILLDQKDSLKRVKASSYSGWKYLQIVCLTD